MSDNFFDSGQTRETTVQAISRKSANGTVIANVEAGFHDCVTTANGTPVKMTSKNIGDLLNGQGVTWGWRFPQSTNSQPIASCPTPLTCLSRFSKRRVRFQNTPRTGRLLLLDPNAGTVVIAR